MSGYRYLLVDGDKYISRASPPGKVTTLTKVRSLPFSLFWLSKLLESQYYRNFEDKTFIGVIIVMGIAELNCIFLCLLLESLYRIKYW